MLLGYLNSGLIRGIGNGTAELVNRIVICEPLAFPVNATAFPSEPKKMP